MHYNYVFCILVYRNTQDILECIESIKENVKDYKILIVNSYYDDESMHEFRNIAKTNNCDFLNVENRGYGYGNNMGIQFAIEHYSFDYIVVSNPDIIIEKFDDLLLKQFNQSVIAPIINNISGKPQNPYWIKKNVLAENLIYRGQKEKKRLLLYSGYAINKLFREIGLKLFLKSQKNEMKVYAAHGSFCIFPKSIFETLGKLYDEEMFLFAEEAYVAHILESNNIDTILTKEIVIRHKEDGSVKISKINEDDELRKSVIYYYEKLGLNQR
ncbi:MAG: hypothetical protein Q4F05_01605 [bacterium]|nr:hypothetical protein [bacterium]